VKCGVHIEKFFLFNQIVTEGDSCVLHHQTNAFFFFGWTCNTGSCEKTGHLKLLELKLWTFLPSHNEWTSWKLW